MSLDCIGRAALASLISAKKESEMLTREQRQSLFKVWSRDSQGMSYLQFRRTVQRSMDCVMVKWCGMWLGIERDGYTHS